MRKLISRLLPLPLLLLLGQLSSFGQDGFPFQIRVSINGSVNTIANGATIFATAQRVGVPLTMSVTATYRGTTFATFNSAPELVGSRDFTVGAVSPVTLQPGQSLSFDVTFTPSTASTVSAQLSLAYTEAGSGPGRLSLTLVGSVPALSVGYVRASDGNFVAVSSGDRIPVPVSVSTEVFIVNAGSAAGEVRSITVEGPGFQAFGVPLLPRLVVPGQQLQFAIRYTPTQSGSSTGKLTITFADSEQSFILEGTASGGPLVYETILNGAVQEVIPEQSFGIGDTLLGQTTSFSFRIRNTGTTSAQISSVSLTGTGFQLMDLPPLPRVIEPQGSLTFTINFTPTQAGQVQGQLEVNEVRFQIQATAVGTPFRYSYRSGTIVTGVAPNGSVLFSPTQIASTARIDFIIENRSQLPAPVASVALPDLTAGFRIVDLPTLPVVLQPNETLTFGILFTPATPNLIQTTLRVDTQSFILSGSGSIPPDLPGYHIDAPATVEALTQPAISLVLDSPYPVPVNGTLTLVFQSDGFRDDPAIQFATGGRTVSFTIPANGTRAVFPNLAEQIRLQSGSVAGKIVIAPSFQLPGGFNITPPNPVTAEIVVPPAPPRLVSAALAASGADTLVLTVTGISSTRTLRQLNIQFNGNPGFNLQGASLSVNVAEQASLWFLSDDSAPFGGQFVLTMSFRLTSSSNRTNPVDAIASASVSVENELGRSNTVEAR
ncbi:MAG: choice-of-anchor D domain-containing protein [Bryobacteraceae bacterium]|nr:choice-of-anchor D domain-containing protein [Bryobacteraceae bacterium]